MEDITLPDILKELTSLVMLQNERSQTEKQHYIGVGITICESIQEENTHFCTLKVSTSCLLPVVDLLKEGYTVKLNQLVLDMQRKSDKSNFFVVVNTPSDFSARNGGHLSVSCTVIRLEAVPTGGVVVTSEQGAISVKGAKEECDGVHFHLRLHREMRIILGEAKTMHDFLHNLRFLQPSMKLSFLLHSSDQICRNDFRYEYVGEINEYSVVTDPRYYIKDAPADSKVYLGIGETHYHERQARITCLACHAARGGKGYIPAKAEGVVSADMFLATRILIHRSMKLGNQLRALTLELASFLTILHAQAYGPRGVPFTSELDDWDHCLSMVQWQTFGLDAAVTDVAASGRCAMGGICKLSLKNASLLPEWVRSGEFVLRLNFIFFCPDDKNAEKETQLWLKQQYRDNLSDLSDTATKALRDLYLKFPQDNKEAKRVHEIFLPMVAESIASIYRRSVSATFREAVEDCLEAGSGLALEARLRDSLVKMTDRRRCKTTRESIDDPQQSTRLFSQLPDIVDVWDDNVGETLGQIPENHPNEHSAVDEEAALDEDSWFAEMEMDLAN